MACIEGLFECSFIDQTAARAIDDPYTLFHFGHGFGTDDVSGFVGEGRVQGDKICPGKKLFQLHFFYPNFLGTLGRKKWVECHNLHFQTDGTAGSNGTDIAATNNTQQLIGKFNTHKTRFLPFACMG